MRYTSNIEEVEYYNEVQLEFADSVYDYMVKKRYGIDTGVTFNDLIRTSLTRDLLYLFNLKEDYYNETNQ